LRPENSWGDWVGGRGDGWIIVGMNEVIAFLLARIGEQQLAAARGLQTMAEHPADAVDYRLATQRIGAAPPEQVFRECEAKRRIVAQLDIMLDADALHDSAERLLRLLALLYADHPDYHEEWQPDDDRA
jgi:hypothetical protein